MISLKVKKIWPDWQIETWEEFIKILDRKQRIVEIHIDWWNGRKYLNQMIELAFHMANKLSDEQKEIIYELVDAQHKEALSNYSSYVFNNHIDEKTINRNLYAFRESVDWLKQYIKGENIFEDTTT